MSTFKLLLVSSAVSLCKQFEQNDGPDLDPNYLTHIMIFMKEILGKNQQMTKIHKKIPSMQRVKERLNT